MRGSHEVQLMVLVVVVVVAVEGLKVVRHGGSGVWEVVNHGESGGSADGAAR